MARMNNVTNESIINHGGTINIGNRSVPDNYDVELSEYYKQLKITGAADLSGLSREMIVRIYNYCSERLDNVGIDDSAGMGKWKIVVV